MVNQLIHRIKLRQSELQASLAVGNAQNWEAYQRMVGTYHGLQSTLDMINDMLDEEKNKD
jgi:hypothetical protein